MNKAKHPSSKGNTENDRSLRSHLLYVMRGGGAHIDFETVIADFPAGSINQKPAHLPYTPWQVLEHMRLAQWDILEFSRNPDHVSPPWPAGYWPKDDIAVSPKDWENSIDSFRKDLKEIEDLIENPATDLFAPISHGDGQTILREALLVADHNAYHLGVLVVLKRLLNNI